MKSSDRDQDGRRRQSSLYPRTASDQCTTFTRVVPTPTTSGCPATAWVYTRERQHVSDELLQAAAVPLDQRLIHKHLKTLAGEPVRWWQITTQIKWNDQLVTDVLTATVMVSDEELHRTGDDPRDRALHETKSHLAAEGYRIDGEGAITEQRNEQFMAIEVTIVVPVTEIT